MNLLWCARRDGGAYQDRLEFSPDLVGCVKTALHGKLWRGTREEGKAKLEALGADICRLMGISEPPPIVFDDNIEGFGAIAWDNSSIFMGKVSLTTYLHELAHHVAAQTGGNHIDEEFPRAFSLGLFKAAAPRMFEKARVDGKILFVNVEYGMPTPEKPADPRPPESGLDDSNASDIFGDDPSPEPA